MGSSSAENGNLGFNDVDFSDRVLRLEIVPAMASNTTSDGAINSEFGSTDLILEKIHINSLMLASKSPFFHKLFNNGMRESQQRDEFTLRISEFEEAAFMDLLNFICCNPMSAKSAPDLVDVLMAADKFEVPSCLRYCVDLLLTLPMSTESALLYLGLPSSVLADEVVQLLIESAKQYLRVRYRNFTKSQGEVMKLPLYAIEIVLGSDDLLVDSEDAVFDFILEWARLHYPELGERKQILTDRLARFICLLNMSSLKLKEVMTDCPDFDSERMWKPVLDALFSTAAIYDYPRRVYNHRLVKMVQLELARPHCKI